MTQKSGHHRDARPGRIKSTKPAKNAPNEPTRCSTVFAKRTIRQTRARISTNVKSRPPYTCWVGAPFCQRDSVVLSHAVFTSEQTLEHFKKCAILSHFFSGTRPLIARCSCSTSRSVVMTFDVEGPFSTGQKASWRTCNGKRPAISACVHYFPMSLSRATRRARPGHLTTPRGVPCPRKNSPRASTISSRRRSCEASQTPVGRARSGCPGARPKGGPPNPCPPPG
jgi:hypothetical protein